MTHQPNQYLRATQIAKEFPISKASVWRYAKLGLLHPRKITSGITVFLRDDVEALFSGRGVVL